MSNKYLQVISNGIINPPTSTTITYVQKIILKGQLLKDLKAKNNSYFSPINWPIILINHSLQVHLQGYLEFYKKEVPRNN